MYDSTNVTVLKRQNYRYKKQISSCQESARGVGTTIKGEEKKRNFGVLSVKAARLCEFVKTRRTVQQKRLNFTV